MSRGGSVGVLAPLRVPPRKSECLTLCCGRILSFSISSTLWRYPASYSLNTGTILQRQNGRGMKQNICIYKRR